MNKGQTSMDNFGGFNDAADIDFFGEGSSTVETTEDVVDTPEPPKKEDEDDTPTPPPVQETEKEEEEEDFFGSTALDADDEESKKPVDTTDNEVPTGKNVSFLQELKERGLADFKLEEGEELTDERAAELIEDSYEAGLESRLEELLQELPPVTRDLVKFAAKGGNESEFLAKLGKQPSVTTISKDMDLTDEKNQEAVIRAQLKLEDHDQDYIDSNIEFLKDSGKLESFAKKYHGKLIEKDEQARAAEVKRLEEQRKQMKENQRQFKSTLAETLKTTKEINGYAFNDKDAKELPSYIGDATIKTENGVISPFQKELFEVLQNKEQTLLLAKLVKSKFDFSAIARKTKTEQTRKVQDDVRRSKSSTTTGSSRNQSRKSLADFFGD